MNEEDKSREMKEEQKDDEEKLQTGAAEELAEEEEPDHADTVEELVKKKADNEFTASGNFANVQIFMQNADFKDVAGLKQVLDLAGKEANDGKKYDLEKEEDCALFFRNCKNNDYVTIAIILSVFELVPVGDISNLKDALMEYLPPVLQLDSEGKKVPVIQTDPYLSLNDILSAIQAKIFVTEEGQQCVGYGKESVKVLENIWAQFPSLRNPIIMWLLKMNDMFEYRTAFEAYQIITAFAGVISEDFLYAKKEIFERLYSNSKNMGLLARLAYELLKKGKTRKHTSAMVLKWAQSDSSWLWKAAFLVYLYADIPSQDVRWKAALTLTVKRKVLGLRRADIRFIAGYAGHFEDMRSFMANIFYELYTSGKEDSREPLALIYLWLIEYGYYYTDDNLIALPFVACDSKEQIIKLLPVLAYLMTRYDLRHRLYSILRVYLEEIACYDVPGSTMKHIVAYFYTLAQKDSDYRKDILLFLRESDGRVARSVYHMLTDIWIKGEGK